MKRELILLLILLCLLSATNVFTQTQCLYVVKTPDVTVLSILNQLGFNVTISTTISSNLSSFDLVICCEYSSCTKSTAPYVGDYVKNGGGAILMGGTPSTFGGGGFSCSNISDWFGTSQYSNVGVSDAKVQTDNPLGTSLHKNDVIDHCTGWGGAAVSNVASDVTILVKWDYGSDNIFNFIRSYQNGRVAFWAGSSSYNSKTTELLKAVCQWTAGFNHIVSTPNTPTGPSSGTVGQSLTFSTGGSTCNQGHSIQYRFDWGDGSYSSWGSSSQNHSYTSAGTYTVKAQARCSVDNSIVSSWSNGFTVFINGVGIPITPSTATTQSAGSDFFVDIVVGSAAKPVTNLYGVSFELGYSTTYIDYVSYDATGSFLGSGLLEYVNPDDPNGKVAVGITRRSTTVGVNGYGSVIKIKFKSLSSTPDKTQVTFAIHNATANDPNGNPIGLSPGSLTITITSGMTVWPGDTNNDGKVNQADVLPLGLYWNQTGPKRTCHANETQWIAHTASPWMPEAATYADANGDGIVNQADVLVIGLNWGKTHTLIKSFVNNDQDESGMISGSLVPKLTYNAERNEVYFDIYAENVTKLFGLAFEASYPHQDMELFLVEVGNLFSQDPLFFYKDQPDLGKIGIGISQKMGQSTVAENDVVSRITFKSLTDEKYIKDAAFRIDFVQANDELGKQIKFHVQACSNLEFSDLSPVPTDHFKLFANYPNPFNPITTISYSLPKATHLRIHVFDLTGRMVKTLVDAEQQPGMHSLKWDALDEMGNHVANGMYICRMIAGKVVQCQKMVLAK